MTAARSFGRKAAAFAFLLSASALVHCTSRKSDERDAKEHDASTVAASPLEPAHTDAAAEPKAIRHPKKHTRVLHTGDSMVGGGLSRALRPKFEADGVKYYRDVIESGTIHAFSQDDHLPGLLTRFKPDLILMTLGSNHVPHAIDPEKELGVYVRKLVKRMEGIDCYWIAPPIWRPRQASFNAWLKDVVAPCRFYDGSHLEIQRRPDKIHPNEKGGEVWADDFWRFYQGEGAFSEETPTVLPSPDTAHGGAPR